MKKLLAILLALTLALTLVPTLAFAQNEDGAEPGIVEESKETPTESPEGETTEEPKEEPQENPEGKTKEEPKEEGKEETREEPEGKLEDTGDVQAAPQNGDPATTLTGDGTAEKPYEIGTADDLKTFREMVNNGASNLCANLTANIDLKNETWTPIGTDSSHAYRGKFDGSGKTIRGLNVTNAEYAGLFGYTDGATIQNMAVDGSVDGTTYAGGIAGYAKGGSIMGCVNQCSVSVSGNEGDDVYAGGIVGYLTDGSTVKNCANLKAIRADGSGNAYAGGIAGYMNADPKISGCYNVGSITGSVTGSIAGYADNGAIANCRWLLGTAEKIAKGSPYIVYYDDSSYIAKTKAHFAEGTVLQLLQNGDNSVWTDTGYVAAAGMTVPLLYWQTADNHTCNTDGVLGGCTCGWLDKGTEDAPYEITTAEDLKDFRDLVNCDQYIDLDGSRKVRCAELMADIVLNDGTFDEDGKWSESGTPYQWEPIGYYTGTFDGGGHTIKGLYVNFDENSCRGLFGTIGNATIQNVTVTGYISTKGPAGGIVGIVEGGAIKNCVNHCTVRSTQYKEAGGIVGYLNSGTLEISDCANYGTVIGNNAGGIVGYGSSDAEKISFQRCLSTGRVEGGSSSGGIAGQIRINSSLTDCINTGAVTGTNSSACVGGIVGGFFSSGDGTMTSCYSVGTVTAPEGAASGGLIGEVGNRYTLPATNCFWLTGTANRAVGESSDDSGTFAMTKAKFADGTVLARLKGNDTNSPWTKTGYLAAAGMALPLLSWQTADEHTCNTDGVLGGCTCGLLPEGKGTENAPYDIKTAEDLKAFRDIVNGNNGQTQNSSACAKLKADIVLNDGTFDDDGNWSGNGTPEVWAPFDPYYGTFDGNGHTIKGLYVKDKDMAGLFGELHGTIKNLAVTGYVQGETFVGGIAATANGGRIENCVNLCRVVAKGNFGNKQAYAGGIVGRDAGGAILNCANLGAISCNVGAWILIDYAAGIAGWVDNTTITRCYNVGGISENGIGEHGSRGIAGAVYSVNVSHCYWLAGSVKDGDNTADDAKTKTEFANELLPLLQNGEENSPWTKTGYLAAANMTLPLLKWQTADDHTHDGAQWLSDATSHWKECTCGAIYDKAAHSGGTATCKDQAKCSICGMEYGALAPDNHTNLKHVPAKAATRRAEGNIEHWYCDGCGKYFKDEAATKEITQADTVIAKKHRTNSDSTDSTGSTADKTVKSSNTGDPGVMLYVGLAAMSLTGGAWLRRKKH